MANNHKPYDLDDPKELRLAAIDRANATWDGLQPGDLAILKTAAAYERYIETGETEPPTIVVPDSPRASSWP